MLKFQAYMKAVKISCEKHSEFDCSCSDCFIVLQDYGRSFGGYGTEADIAVRDMLGFASQLDTAKWHPFMTVGHMVTGPSGGYHSMGWTEELYLERKVKYDKFHHIK